MSSGPTLEHDPARANSTADRGTQLGGVTRLLTGVLTFIFRVRVASGRLLAALALAARRLLAGVLTIVLLPLTLLRDILVVILRPFIALGRIVEMIAREIARQLSLAAEWVRRGLARIAHALLSAIGAILAPLVRAARRLLLLVRGFLTVILLPLVALGWVLAKTASVLWLVAERVGGALVSFIQTLLRIAREVARQLSLAARWVKRRLARIAHALLSAIGAILALLVRAARRLLLLVRGFLAVMLLPLMALGWVLARTASVLWLVAARVGGALMRVMASLVEILMNAAASLGSALTSAAAAAAAILVGFVRALLRPIGAVFVRFIQALLRSIRAILAPFVQACRRVGELLRRLRTWFATLVGRLLMLVVRLMAWPLVALAKLARRAAAPLVALLHRVPEWMGRVEHSVLVAGTKAKYQATRSLQAPVAAPDRGGASTPSADPPVPFQAAVYQNEHLPRGGMEVNAIVTVTAGSWDGSVIDGARGPVDRTQPSAPEAAEVIMLDCSGSMAYPPAKLREAQRATAAAIESLRDGTWFALVRATERAELAYPPAGGLARASPETRRAAKRAAQLMWPEGGTAMGQWLMLARDLLASRPSAIAHAILLTDGSNESESREALESALAKCAGRFQCDCRGVGTDWRVKELRMIASRLLGTVDIVAEPAGLEADFRSMIEQAMSKATGDVSLRLWTPRGAGVAFLKQVAPTIEDLTDRANPVDALTADYPTGAWGDESRDYHLCVHVPTKEIGEEMLAARVSMVVAGHVASQALVRAIWTDDEQLSTRINREVAHYTGQAELADAIQEGLEARKQGDEHTATSKLGRAVALAAAAGNSDTMKLLEGVVDVQDAHTGTVRLKRRVQDADEMALDTRSTKTVRVQGL
jgi:von Willebrand factor type A C-terminal domain/von Willebrand factor type A domain